jgi:DNA-binding LacI/PurR family transcriptional regulator
MRERPTSHDVARIAGVSRTTVSLVLNGAKDVRIREATRQRVFAAAEQLNYHPNISGRRLASGKSYTLGLVLRQNPDQVFADMFLLKVLLGVEHASEQANFRVLLKPLAPDNPDGYTGLIHENHVDGIILSGPRQDDLAILRVHQQGFPVILMGQLPGCDIPFVDVDAIAGARTATQHLIDLGHTRIAIITNAPLEYTSAQQRLEGYRQAHRDTGIEPNDTLVAIGGYTPASGYIAMTHLLSISPRPTAVFIASDVVAMGAVQAAKLAGLSIPEDLAIVGFDDVPLSEYYDPPLTTIRLPAYELGQAVAEQLSKLVAGQPLEQQGLLLGTELIVRSSSSKSNVPQRVSSGK